ncbi:hypothetical protein [Agromyces sp. PvR057]|uniref:hypothetical protein n=1 Tax=Agromyces sp. PvR057 TaxID=3156403 RepID=UPI000E3A9310
MYRLGVVLALALLLTGCDAATEPDPSPGASVSPAPVAGNAEACATFAQVTRTVGDAVTGDRALATDIPAEFAKAYQIAEGEVKVRIQTLVDDLPEPPHMIAWMDHRDAYASDVEAVARACDADGSPLGEYTTLVGATD